MARSDQDDVRKFVNESSLEEAALTYVSPAYKFLVFPCAPGDKPPALPRGRGPGGFYGATANKDQIKRWWSAHPDYNIGIALRLSGLAVVDIDTHDADGSKTLEELEERFGRLPPTFTVRSGGGGLHYYYRVPDEAWYEEYDVPKKLAEGIDFLTNGYTVAPPSVHPDGGSYAVTKGQYLEDFAPVPTQWLLNAAGDQTLRRHDAWEPEDEEWFAGRGERDNVATNVAGILRRRFSLNAEEIENVLRVMAETRFEDVPGDPIDFARIARGVARYPPGEIHPTEITLSIRKTRRKKPESLSNVAFHGPLGEWVRYIEPYTEAHPAALMMQAVVAFGNMIGAKHREDPMPGFIVEQTPHNTCLYLMLVGDSAKAGKGDSWSRVRHLMRHVDSSWQPITGLQTGEGAIQALQDDEEGDTEWHIKHGDEEEVKREVKKKGRRNDRRFLVFESEFGRPLHVASRPGATLKDIYRELWDTGGTQKHTAGQSQIVTNACVSLVGHITKPELERDFSDVDMMSGFGNRFLYCFTHRVRNLTSAPSIPLKNLKRFIVPLKDALEFAQDEAPEDYEFTDEARELWDDLRADWQKEDPSPMIDAITARARPIVRRTALILAVTDLSDVIDVPHLEAANALWEYSERSARYIFGSSLGDRVQDKILLGLKEHPAGLTRSEISRVIFKNNMSGEKIGFALTKLIEREIVHVREEKDGRKKTQMFFIQPGGEW